MVDRVNRTGGKDGVGAAQSAQSHREEAADRTARIATPASIGRRPEAAERHDPKAGALVAALLAYAAPKAVDRRLLEPELLCGELETVLERLEAAPATDDIAHVAKLALREELDRLHILFTARGSATARQKPADQRREGGEAR